MVVERVPHNLRVEHDKALPEGNNDSRHHNRVVRKSFEGIELGNVVIETPTWIDIFPAAAQNGRLRRCMANSRSHSDNFSDLKVV